MMELAVERRRAEGRLADLYRRHAPDAVRLAWLITGNEAQAEDLAHDAFIRVAGRFGDLRDPDAFNVYLKRTVINLANSFFRRRRVERAFLEAEGRGARPSLEAVEHDPVERDRLWRTLMILPPRQRAAIVLRYYEDLSESQTANLLQCPVGTVKSLVSRGLETLRREVER
jgi:RNA polymerase sigma-70 factor (sigma-E family)